MASVTRLARVARVAMLPETRRLIVAARRSSAVRTLAHRVHPEAFYRPQLDVDRVLGRVEHSCGCLGGLDAPARQAGDLPRDHRARGCHRHGREAEGDTVARSPAVVAR